MREVAFQSIVGKQKIRVQRRSRLDVFPHFSVKGFLPTIGNHTGTDFTRAVLATLKDSDYRRLVLAARPSDARRAFSRVHVPRFSADESFIGFDVPRKFIRCRHSERNANPVIHEPCGFLRHADCSMNFIRANAVLAVHNHPHRREPLVQAKRGIFENSAGLRSELAKVMLLATLPTVVLRLKNNAVTAATRASNTLRPAMSYEISSAVIRISEVQNRFLQGVRSSDFHVSIVL